MDPLVRAAAKVAPAPGTFEIYLLKSFGYVSDELIGPAPRIVSQLADRLVVAAGRGGRVAVASLNPDIAERGLTSALEQIKDEDLTGLTIIFVGELEASARVDKIVSATGAQYLFAQQP